MENSRRTFLKIAGISALGLSAKPVFNAFAVSEEHGEKKEAKVIPKKGTLTAKRWAMVIDTTKFKSAKDLEPIIEASQSTRGIDLFIHRLSLANFLWIVQYLAIVTLPLRRSHHLFMYLRFATGSAHIIESSRSTRGNDRFKHRFSLVNGLWERVVVQCPFIVVQPLIRTHHSKHLGIIEDV